MTELRVFDNEEFGSVRTTTINDEIYFVGKDVAEILGYTNTPKAIKDHVDDEDKLTERFVMSGQNRDAIVINESGLYSLVLSSKLPNAKKFKRWVTSDVLPSIRKHGAYMTEQTLEKALTSPDFLIQLATKLKEEQEKNKSLQNKIEEDRPKVVFADAVSVSDDCILIRDLAKLLKQNGFNLGEKKLFALLRNKNYLIKTGVSYNTPTQKAMEMGIFKLRETVVTDNNGKTHIVKTTMVTAKGQEYFLSKLIKMKEDYLKNLEIGKGE